MLKKSIFLLFGLLIMFSLPSLTAFANEEIEEVPLTEEEIAQLKNNVGLTDEMINDLPITELRILIEEGSVLEFHQAEVIDIFEPEVFNPGEFKPMQGGDLDPKKIKITGYAFYNGKKTSGTYSGYRQYKLVGNWEWLTAPSWYLTDGFSVGWGSTDLKLPTRNNAVDEFWGYYYRYDGTKKTWYLTSTRNPNTYEPNGGVGYKFDLRGGLTRHKGSLTQYVYTRASRGDINVKFEYGHAQMVGATVTFGKNAGSFGIAPTFGVKTGYAADEIVW